MRPDFFEIAGNTLDKLSVKCKQLSKKCNGKSNLETETRSMVENSFRDFVFQVKLGLGHCNTVDEKVLFLDYIINMVKYDLCSGTAARELYSSTTDAFLPKPIYEYRDENNQNQSIISENAISIDMADSDIYVFPWNIFRTISALFDLKNNEFTQSKNHEALFFTDIDLCCVFNGGHHIHASKYYKKGKLICKVCNTELLYPHVTTDGIHWINSHNNSKISDVYDFRLASLYAAAKLRNKYLRATEK